ncbi:hypothetical protein [Streptomyces hilarionis]|uniref:hypothetical protein n=1 Tax=Streptomyces hilarionis TaxID=2839954 RepID=UPI002119E258|nr:hypothetical protein [Streptomyces hilarionis]MCQ9134125.1 hypothetical protein [Streptomyces hilarionis]
MRIRVTAAALCTAALVAGCSGGGGTGVEDSGAARAGSGSAAGPAPHAAGKGPSAPLGEGRLTSAALTSADVDGYQITDYPVRPHGGSTARPAQCQPLENMRTAVPDPAPRAFQGRLAFSGSGPGAGAATTIGLMAYDRSGAEGVLQALRTALKKCTAFEGGVPARTTARAAAAPDAGDEAVAFALHTERDSPDAYVVVRSGSTVVLFCTASGTGAAAQVPGELVSAQIRKLEA